MSVVLGLDAAWTATGSSGVALIDTDHDRPRVVAIAPGYRDFTALRHGAAVDWSARPAGGEPPLPELLDVAAQMARKPVDVIVVDMPLSKDPITGRRPADNAISATYGGRGCSTHTPSAERPGPISARLREAAGQLGYPLVTAAGEQPGRALLETYPHPAILHLTGADFRVPYKVARIRRYWPALAPVERRTKVAKELQRVRDKLRSWADGLALAVDTAAPIARLKAVEDVIDALVCCWVGARWLDGAADAYGDDAAAIWVPHPPAGA